MIKVYTLTEENKNHDVELGLFHGGLLYIAKDGEWGHEDYIQLTVESARELAKNLEWWANAEERSL